MDPPRRYIPPRLRPHDGLPLNRVLPIHPRPRNLQSPRCKRHIQRQRKLSQHLVRQTSRLRARRHSLRIKSGRCDFPNHGIESDSQSRIPLGNAYLRLFDPGYVGHFQRDPQVEAEAYQEAV